jgi:hypothetical protein
MSFVAILKLSGCVLPLDEYGMGQARAVQLTAMRPCLVH